MLRIQQKPGVEFEFHAAANLFPIDAENIDSLVEDIQANGLHEPIELFDGQILDGRRRYMACRQASLPFQTITVIPDDPIAYVLSLNLHRRHLNTSQRAMVAARARELYDQQAKERQKRKPKSVPAKLPEQKGDARDRAGKAAGVSGKSTDYATRVLKEAPAEIVQAVDAGRMPVSTAFRAVQREEKKAKLLAKAQEAADSVGESSWKILRGDCLDELAAIRGARLIFSDPPYNIGIDYGDGKHRDLLPKAKYLDWCREWLSLCADALTPDGSLWVMICDEWVEYFALALTDLCLHRRAWIKWYETFGVNCTNNFNRCSRHILYYVADPKHFVFNAESSYIRRQSDRQAKYGDKRADPHGKLLDDVWAIPRLVDNAAERVPGFPTQVPEEVLLRIVACASEPGDLVVDPFSGSATTGAAAIRLGRRYIGIERGEEFWRLSTARLAGVTPFAPDAR